ncbi:HpcH/HpaI aldolase/citrate lyase family protein [Phytohalomonas tamaricis]|uniref:HpcH/HpaI aldolase/citrate lyase family protein n=1 Tax=Phytohalomonas tamaricis TaxID=2081032 RepID=UPI000D0AC631|nr:CoA ester lyase [Phytohalomonas tamaricis]
MCSRPVRSALFVPATRPERIPKALASGADAVIVDLEDAVAADAKQQARDALEAFLTHHPEARLFVRVNSPDSVEYEADLALCARHEAVAGLVVAKAERADALQCALSCCPRRPLCPLIESARGLANVAEIAAVDGVERLSFGAFDLALDLDLLDGHEGAEAILDQARYALIIQSKVAGLAAPLAGVEAEISDTDSIARAARRARAMGFGGMLCIHPAQLEPVHRAFSATPEELSWAHRVIAADNGAQGAFSVDGQMVDAPIIARARRILARGG